MKKIAALTAAGVMVFGFSTMSMANIQPQAPMSGFASCPGRSTGSRMMWDDDGNFLTREAFEERLAAWIADGIISAQDRSFMLKRFDWCLIYGGGSDSGCVGNLNGGFGRGCGGNRGGGRGWQ